MKNSIKVGFGFGLTSGVITTLGMMLGLYSTTHSKIVLIGGILSIAIADAFSDSMGIHVSQEAENHHSQKEIWESTISTFFGKLIFALSFILPVAFLRIEYAIFISIIWGLFLLTVFSFNLARTSGQKPHLLISEHLVIAIVVIIATYFLGSLIRAFFV